MKIIEVTTSSKGKNSWYKNKIGETFEVYYPIKYAYELNDTQFEYYECVDRGKIIRLNECKTLKEIRKFKVNKILCLSEKE